MVSRIERRLFGAITMACEWAAMLLLGAVALISYCARKGQ